MSLYDEILTIVEDRLVFLDKSGSGVIQYLVLKNDEECQDEIRSFRLRRLPSEELRNLHEFAAFEFCNRLYVTGGYHVTDMRHVSRTLQFDPATHVWTELKPMIKARAKHCMVSFENCLLVAGGETSGGKITSSCEVYDVGRNEWREFASLPWHRCWMACANVNGDLFASGGFCGGRGHDNLWIYEKKSKAWRNLDKHFPIKLSACMDRHAMVTLGDTIYFIGGVQYPKHAQDAKPLEKTISTKPETRAAIDGLKPTVTHRESDKFERWKSPKDLDTVTPWVYGLPAMLHSRHSAGVAILDGRIYVFGGTNNEYRNAVHETDVFDQEKMHWTEEGTLRGGDSGNLICARLTFTETKIVKRALPRSWPLW